MLLSPANMAAALERVEQDSEDPKLRGELLALCRRLFDVALPAVNANEIVTSPDGHLDRRDIA